MGRFGQEEVVREGLAEFFQKSGWNVLRLNGRLFAQRKTGSDKSWYDVAVSVPRDETVARAKAATANAAKPPKAATAKAVSNTGRGNTRPRRDRNAPAAELPERTPDATA